MALCKRLTAGNQEGLTRDQENEEVRRLVFSWFSLFPSVSAFQGRLRLAVDGFFVALFEASYFWITECVTVRGERERTDLKRLSRRRAPETSLLISCPPDLLFKCPDAAIDLPDSRSWSRAARLIWIERLS